MLKISLNPLISEGTRQMLLQVKMRNIEMNVQIEEKPASFTDREEWMEPLWKGQNLHVYKQELLCMAISYLHSPELEKSSYNIK